MIWLKRWVATAWRGKFGPTKSRSHHEALKLRSELVRLYTRGQLGQAVGTARQLVDWQRRAPSPSGGDLAIGLANLGRLLQRAGDAPGSAAAMAEAEAIRSRETQRPATDLTIFELLMELEAQPPQDAGIFREVLHSARAWLRGDRRRSETTRAFEGSLQLLDRLDSPSVDNPESRSDGFGQSFSQAPYGDVTSPPRDRP